MYHILHATRPDSAQNVNSYVHPFLISIAPTPIDISTSYKAVNYQWTGLLDC